jgi:phosphate transport system permease protein
MGGVRLMALATTIGVGPEAAADRVRRQLCQGGADVGGKVFQASLLSALVIAVLILVFLLADVWHDASGVLPSRLGPLLSQQYTSRAERAGIFNALRGTFWIGVCTVLSFPVGIAAAVYLEEYARRGRFTNFVNVNIRNLSGVPSVVYGIFGLSILVDRLRGLTGGRTVIAAGITIAVLVLPIVIITSAEAVRAVPRTLREGAFGLGATRWEVIRTQVLPYAAPGILTGTVLSLARALGEAAPLLLVGAVGERLADNHGFFDLHQLRGPFTALPIAITDWTKRPRSSGFFELSAASIIVMLVIVLLTNSIAIVLRNRFERKRG